MKSLDEHLRDASQAWMQESTPTMVTSADAIAKTLRPRSWFPWGFGALGLGVVLSVGVYVAVQYSAEPSVEITKPVTSQTIEPNAAPISIPMGSTPTSTVIATRATAPATLPARSAERVPSMLDTRLKVEGQADGFTAEYERVLAQAMSLEAADPVRAVNEYMGLVRLCERRQKYAHAVTALERASMLAEQIGDVNLKTSVDTKLAEIKGMLAP